MSKKHDKAIEDKVISLYVSGKSMSVIGNEFGITPATVMRILNKHNVQKRTKGGIYKLDNDAIVREYLNGDSSSKISKKYGVTEHTITDILEKNGVPRNNIYHNVLLNENYWSNINSYDKAYFLGLLITDGNVFDNMVRIQLSSKDEHILITLTEKTNSSNKIYRSKNNLSAFSVKRKKWVDDLSKYGVVPNKTATVQLPKIDDKLMNHLFRGLFDGDGWITKTGRCIGFCGNETLVTQVRDFLVERLGVYKVKVVHQNTNLWMVSWASKTDVAKIGGFIYADKCDCYLFRKYNNFLCGSHVNTEVSSEITKGSETP